MNLYTVWVYYLLSIIIVGLIFFVQSVENPVRNAIQDLRVFRTTQPFDRRCTALDWHPTRHGILVVASKGLFGYADIWSFPSNLHAAY